MYRKDDGYNAGAFLMHACIQFIRSLKMSDQIVSESVFIVGLLSHGYAGRRGRVGCTCVCMCPRSMKTITLMMTMALGDYNAMESFMQPLDCVKKRKKPTDSDSMTILRRIYNYQQYYSNYYFFSLFVVFAIEH